MNLWFQLIRLCRFLCSALGTLVWFVLHPWTRRAGVGLLVGGGVAYELETSTLQAHFLSRYAAKLTYTVTTGPSPRIAFPHEGPFNIQRGYVQLPIFHSRLAATGYQITDQAQVSPELARLINWGVAPPYRELADTGLTIRDARGRSVYNHRPLSLLFQRFEDIPPLVVATLLFIEN